LDQPYMCFYMFLCFIAVRQEIRAKKHLIAKTKPAKNGVQKKECYSSRIAFCVQGMQKNLQCKFFLNQRHSVSLATSPHIIGPDA